MRVGLSESVKVETSFGFQCDCLSSSSLDEAKTIEDNRSTGRSKLYLTYLSELGYDSLSLHKTFDVIYRYIGILLSAACLRKELPPSLLGSDHVIGNCTKYFVPRLFNSVREAVSEQFFLSQ
jgi:hypothetical protein